MGKKILLALGMGGLAVLGVWLVTYFYDELRMKELKEKL